MIYQLYDPIWSYLILFDPIWFSSGGHNTQGGPQFETCPDVQVWMGSQTTCDLDILDAAPWLAGKSPK